MAEFVLTEARRVFDDDRNPYIQSLRAVAQAAESRAQDKLENKESGGIAPVEGEYGTIEPRPTFFSGQGNGPGNSQITAGGSNFRQSTPGSTGFSNALAADLSDDGEIGTDWVMGLGGFLLMEPTLRYSELRIIAGDRTLAVLNIEDANIYDQPAVIFNMYTDADDKMPADVGSSSVNVTEDAEAFVFDEDTHFTLEANFTSTEGSYRVKPLATCKVPQTDAIAQAP